MNECMNEWINWGQNEYNISLYVMEGEPKLHKTLPLRWMDEEWMDVCMVGWMDGWLLVLSELGCQ